MPNKHFLLQMVLPWLSIVLKSFHMSYVMFHELCWQNQVKLNYVMTALEISKVLVASDQRA